MNDKKLSEALESNDWEEFTGKERQECITLARALEERVESLKSALEAADPLNAAADRLGRVNDQKRFQLDLAAATARVAELEGQLKEAGSMVIAATNRDHTATARAEAAEKECTELREIAAQRCTQAEAAEARLATARLTYEECMETQRQLQASRDEAWAESDAAEAEVARLRSEPAWQLAQNLEATMRTAEAAERKLEMHIAAHDMTSDQLEAAEAERKEFMLETQRKEIECNELASEVARLRELDVKTVCEIHTLTDERDALRAKLEKVRAVAVKWAETAHPAAYVGARDIRAILDGEGGDE